MKKRPCRGRGVRPTRETQHSCKAPGAPKEEMKKHVRIGDVQMNKRSGIVLVSLLMILFVAVSFAETAPADQEMAAFSDPDAYLAYRLEEGPAVFAYENDPAENQAAMKDIVVNPEAVFGFSPSPDSTRLKDYVDALDWTSPEQVAQARDTRRAYHESMSELYRMIEDMLGEAKPVEEIARAVSARRNEIRIESYQDDPEGLARLKQSNLDTYGNELGPTADSLYEKYGSWQMVLEKALGTNAGMDACLGFYDEYFEFYDINDLAEE